ncbi:MAG: zinc ribbon domain-containing protein [Anaerolineales bacterium]|nr:zinc ribbon domain-containing protein [Anaerolineales bacterium]MCB9433838.1 zinc ribbon domain-containing protein [Ardenticatenaceae bacterium]
MPMYQYQCRSCEQPFEKRLSMSRASDPQDCPACGSADTRKRLGAIALGGLSSSVSMAAPQPAPRRIS